MATNRPIRRQPAERSQFARPGAALLEVVVALSILLVAMAVVGVTFSNGEYYIQQAEMLARADIMTERLIGEVETGIVGLSAPEQFGNFADEGPPDMMWRVVVNPDANVPDLLRVDIDIFKGDVQNDPDNASIVTSTHLLRAMPKSLDLARDFGFDEDQLAQLTDAVPGGEAVLDPKNFDPRSLASLDLEMLAQLLPTLIQAFGGNLSGGDLSGLLQAAANGDPAILQQLQNAVQQTQNGETGQPGADAGGEKPQGNPPPPADAGAPQPRGPRGGGGFPRQPRGGDGGLGGGNPGGFDGGDGSGNPPPPPGNPDDPQNGQRGGGRRGGGRRGGGGRGANP